MGRWHALMILSLNLCPPRELRALSTEESAQPTSRGMDHSTFAGGHRSQHGSYMSDLPLCLGRRSKGSNTADVLWTIQPCLPEHKADISKPRVELLRELSEHMGGPLKCLFKQNSNFTSLHILQEHFTRKVSNLACQIYQNTQ